MLLIFLRSDLNPRHLQNVVPEEDRRKNMTGEWFYEVKSQRHQDRIHGSDIIIASMKQRKPSLDGNIYEHNFTTIPIEH